MKSVFYYDFPIGPVGIIEEDGAISGLFFHNKKDTTVSAAATTETPLIKKAAAQLNEYFDRKRKVFDLPLLLRGTNFQVTVWKALQTIPYGETRSYKDMAVLAGNPKACRAAGMANHRNPIAIIVPCHRVIGSDGSLTGYAGGLEVKRYLLELEGGAPPVNRYPIATSAP
jgi:methylated-DNA-[protein]-cysteine S-methyltransferase